MNKDFLELLEKAKAIHEKKNQDYTTNPNVNPSENFERAAIIASWFPEEHKVFATLIGVKIARLAALLTSRRAPNNESIDDTFLDQFTYTGLWYSWYKRLNNISLDNPFVGGSLIEFSETDKYDKEKVKENATFNCIHQQLDKAGYCIVCCKKLNSMDRQGKYRIDPATGYFHKMP